MIMNEKEISCPSCGSLHCPNCGSLNCKIDYSYPTMDTNPPEYSFVCQECKEIF
jgi:hypothetical protein